MELNITLVRADTNQAYDVDLPGDQPMSALMPEIIKAMGLPRATPDGELIAYEISSKRTGEVVGESATLGMKGVKTGDVLLLTSSFVAGGGVRLCGEVAFLFVAVWMSIVNVGRAQCRDDLPALNLFLMAVGITGFIALHWLIP